MTGLSPRFRFMGLAIAAGSLAGCGIGTDTAPYIAPVPFYGEPSPQFFALRYSPWFNTDEEIRQMIADTCDEEHLTARIFDQGLLGTALHPRQIYVVCGDPAPPQPVYPRQPLDQGYLIQLRDPGGRALTATPGP